MQITVEVPEIHCVRCPATGAVMPTQLRRLQPNAQAPLIANDSIGGRWFVQAEKPADWQELTGKDGNGYLCPACVTLWKTFIARPAPEAPRPTSCETMDRAVAVAATARPILVQAAIVGAHRNSPIPTQAAPRVAPAPVAAPPVATPAAATRTVQADSAPRASSIPRRS